MKIRIISAIAALSILLPGLIYGGVTGIHIIVILASALAADEYLRMMVPDCKKIWPVFHAMNLGVLVALVYFGIEHHFPILILSFLTISSASLFLTSDNNEGLKVILRCGAGLLYLSLFVFLINVREFQHGLTLIFFILITTWSADTGAYFAGRAFGNKKLFPRVSPNKTWAGAYGGFALSILAALLLSHFFLPEVGLIHGAILGALICIFSIIGDLIESMVKRAVGVKDSGWIMPGHGGILDRVDSLLFTAPVTWFYLTYNTSIIHI